jgi:dCMP deaminase
MSAGDETCGGCRGQSIDLNEHGLCARCERDRVKTRPGWDAYFLGIAAAVATRADCTRRQVGVVLVSADRRVMSTGYNGAPAGEPGCASAGACPRGQAGHAIDTRTPYSGAGACIAVHAEDNALRYAGLAPTDGAWAYVTCEPCTPCYELFMEAGIGKVIWPTGHRWLPR